MRDFEKQDFVTRFGFNGTVIVEVSSDYDDTVAIEVNYVKDKDDEGRAFNISPDEVDVFISVLNLYKNRILNRKGESNR